MVLFIALIPIQNIRVAIGFAIGGLFSAAAGYIGMNVSVRANARVAEAARGGVARALDVAFRGGAVTGLLVVGLALIGVAGYYGVLTWIAGESQRHAVDALIGLGFGGSLISVFARLGGGIFTKAADVGADLVGKIEAGIPEDDPRNPAVIADNVGDNVGDCAGMAADLFETYAVTAVAVMLLGVLLFNQQSAVALYPLVLGAVAIVASIIGTFAVQVAGRQRRARAVPGADRLRRAGGARVHPGHLLADARRHAQGRQPCAPHWWKFYLCALIGIGDHRAAVRDHRLLHLDAVRAGQEHRTGLADRPRDEHHPGPRAGVPVDRAARDRRSRSGILGAWKLGGGGTQGIYGIAVAVMAMLSLAGFIVALDAFGPITDNAGGIAEMADLPEEVRNVTDPLDAVGNTTKAVTKGYAIGSAALAALVLFNAFEDELQAKGKLPETSRSATRPC